MTSDIAGFNWVSLDATWDSIVSIICAGGSQAMMPVTSADQDCLLVYDGIDNPVALLTDFGTNAFSYQYDPWGVPTLTSGASYNNGVVQNPYTFHSGTKDTNSGLIHFGARWYDPETGTWTQQDTLNPANANRYAYAGDDPINNLDPTGELSEGLARAAGIASGFIFGGLAAIALAPLASLGPIGIAADFVISGAIGGAIGGETTAALDGGTYDPISSLLNGAVGGPPPFLP